MKYIFIRESYKKFGNSKIKFVTNTINENTFIDELLLDAKWLERILLKKAKSLNNLNKYYYKFVDKIKIKLLKTRLYRMLKKHNYLLKNEDADDNIIKYVLSSEIRVNSQKKNLLDKILQELELQSYATISEYQDNIDRYIESHMNKTKRLPSDIKILIFVNDINRFEFEKIHKLVNKYKKVDFNTCVETRKSTSQKLDRINKEEGTTSCIISLNNKNIKEYNVCVFIDVDRTKYAKYKFGKNTTYIDTSFVEADIYNSYYLKLQECIKKEIVDEKNIKNLFAMYGKITVSTIIISNSEIY